MHNVTKQILRDRFLRLLQIRARKILDSVKSHASLRTSFAFENELNFTKSFRGTVQIIAKMLRELNKHYPYNQIKDWHDNAVILVDVDNTLFSKEGDPCYGGHCFGNPVKDVIEVVNELYDCGCIIKIFTGRMNQYVLNIDKTIKPALESALRDAGVKYHEILELQKPNAEVILDDLAINPILY